MGGNMLAKLDPLVTILLSNIKIKSKNWYKICLQSPTILLVAPTCVGNSFYAEFKQIIKWW